MNPDYRELSPTQAWAPLPKSQWNEELAAHLLRRAGFAALPSEVERAVFYGLSATISRMFREPPRMPIPYKIQKFGEENAAVFRRRKNISKEDRRNLRKQLRQKGNEAYLDYGIQWLIHARNPANSPYEKWVLFLQDVFVVGLPKVRNPYFLFLHQSILRNYATGNFDRLCKAVSRSPAMVQYLDLQRNVKGKPNENFARELFELFMLGEGNYSERDIKEAARAFTGYKTDVTGFRFIPGKHDVGRKVIFGQKGNYSGDDVIDLALNQPAVRTFLPAEVLRYYLSSEVVFEPPYLKRLGEVWRGSGFNLGNLIATVFGSRIFYHPQFRGNLIKSPVQFYLGMLQDLNLDVAPFPKVTLNALRNMGQTFFAPPNVRGWVGGKLWINSSTFAARHQSVDFVFSPMNEDKLNADDYAELMIARMEKRGNLTVSRAQLERMADMGVDEMVDHLSRLLFATPVSPEYRQPLVNFLNNAEGRSLSRVKELTVALMQSPQYQVC